MRIFDQVYKCGGTPLLRGRKNPRSYYKKEEKGMKHD